MKHPFLIGQLTYLRGLEKEDLTGNYFQWFNDQDVCRYNSHGRFPNNAPSMEAYLNRAHTDANLLVLAIVVKADETHVGNASLQNIDWITRSAEFAIVIGEKKYWGKGIVQEVADLVLRHAFVGLNLHRVYMGTFSTNSSAMKLASYMGMQEEGRRRQAAFKDGKFVDVVEYGILREEYERGKDQGAS